MKAPPTPNWATTCPDCGEPWEFAFTPELQSSVTADGLSDLGREFLAALESCADCRDAPDGGLTIHLVGDDAW